MTIKTNIQKLYEVVVCGLVEAALLCIPKYG